jgi:hypothetical protein
MLKCAVYRMTYVQSANVGLYFDLTIDSHSTCDIKSSHRVLLTAMLEREKVTPSTSVYFYKFCFLRLSDEQHGTTHQCFDITLARWSFC